nr:DNA adenine methylase [uncultured Bacillus sp.]
MSQISIDTTLAKPFLKWAGGKTQLIPEIDKRLPNELREGKIKRYIEPFVGSGAVLFHLLQNYKIEEAFIFDINPELVLVYEVIKKDVNALVQLLEMKEKEYISLDKDSRKNYFYEQRITFNSALETFNFNEYGEHKILRASEFIFLNKTCFNGLFRVNKAGLFNVPMGDYKNPTICNKENLFAVNRVLQNVVIANGDYRESRSLVAPTTFVYFDPPYRPLNISSSFTSYSKFDFRDEEQIELGNFFEELHKMGALLMLSNSDPQNTNPDDTFFEEIYEGFSIEKVSARRSINSKASSRGQINELLVTNYLMNN